MRKSTETLDEKPPPPLPTPQATRSSKSSIFRTTEEEKCFTEFHHSFYWLALNHRRLGLSHFAMLFILAIYSLTGAVLFYWSEHQYEVDVRSDRRNPHTFHFQTVANTMARMQDYFSVLSEELEARYNYTLNLNNTDVAAWLEVRHSVAYLWKYLKDVYIRSLQQEGIYQWTTYYKAENPTNNMKWSFPGAIFFTFNVFTTTGYGRQCYLTGKSIYFRFNHVSN